MPEAGEALGPKPGWFGENEVDIDNLPAATSRTIYRDIAGSKSLVYRQHSKLQREHRTMIRSEALAIRDLFLRYGYPHGSAQKQYISHHLQQDWMVKFLFDQKLRSEHKLLDIGCGWLRLADVIVPYLNEGNYYGIEREQLNLDMGLEWIARDGATIPKLNLLCDSDFLFEKFAARFDYAFCGAVFTHLSHDEVRRCLEKTMSVMNSGGLGFYTFYLSEEDRDIDAIYEMNDGSKIAYKSAHISLNYFAELFAELGLKWKHIGRQGHPSDHDIIKVFY